MDDIAQHCGEVSGREHDKFSECKLKLFKSRFVRAPIIAQCKLHYECRVVQRTDIIPRLIPARFFIRVMITKVEKFFIAGAITAVYTLDKSWQFIELEPFKVFIAEVAKLF